MTYWLGVDTPEVWEEAQRKYNLNEPHPFGFPEGRRKSVQRMKIGDRIVNYITKRQRFFAVWEVTKGYIYDPTNTFANNKAFPECVEVSPVVRLAPEEGIENPGVSVRQSAVRLDDEVGERILSALRDRVPASELESDLQAINQQKTATERKQYIDARLGQGQFRTKLLERWGNRCAVTGNAVRDARASHAKPWKISTDQERLDPENGLPLLATLDALFDAGLITFNEIGRMTLSPKLTAREQAELDQLGVSNTRRLQREPTEKERSFLAYHRDYVFQK